MSVSVGRSFKRAVNVPAGNAPKAASVGANKVNGPGPESVASNSQVSIAN